MKTLKAILIETSRKTGTELHILEQDYALSWVLSGIASHPQLSKILVFKGGTALKKCYFGDYRFSQDLDFTLISDTDNVLLFSYVKEACLLAKQQLKDSGQGCEIVCKEYQADKPHPHDQRAYNIAIQFSWHRKPLVSVFVEITKDEVIIAPIKTKALIHNYGETIENKLQVYCLEEIIMEKLRATLQQIIKLHERGWGRSRARDFYDIWMIFNKYQDDIDLHLIRSNIEKKFMIKKITLHSQDDFFDPRYLDELIRTWHQWLSPFVEHLPESNIVINDIKEKILPMIFGNKHAKGAHKL